MKTLSETQITTSTTTPSPSVSTTVKPPSRTTLTTSEPLKTSTTRAPTTVKPSLTTAYPVSTSPTRATTKQHASETTKSNPPTTTRSVQTTTTKVSKKYTQATTSTSSTTPQPTPRRTSAPRLPDPRTLTTLSTESPTKSISTTFSQTPHTTTSTSGPAFSTTFLNQPTTTSSTSTTSASFTPITRDEIQKTDFVSVSAMETDHYCDAFDCVIDIEPVDICFTYFKEIADIDCHLFCKLDNCTKQPSTEIYCPKYTCVPKPSPSPGPTPPPPGPIPPIPGSDNLAIIITVFVATAIFLGFSFFVGICVYRRRNASNSQAHQNIEQGNAESNPFVVATPSMSSSEDLGDDDFETTPAAASAIMAPTSSFDPTLENEVQAIIDKHKRSGSVASTTTNLSDELESVQNTFKMCTLKKRNPIPNSNMIETSVC